MSNGLVSLCRAVPLRRVLSLRLAQAARAALLATALALPAVPAGAAAPAPMTQAPGYYRMVLGDFEITAVSDGTINLPMDQLLVNAAPGEVKRGFERAFVGLPAETSVNGYLVNTGSKLVLIDTGAGSFFGPTLGRFVTNLRAAGYTPEQVDEIYITHFHGDHVGGLVDKNGMVFPNAIVRADQREADYWLSKERLDAAPEDNKGGFRAAQSALQPYLDAGHFKPFTGDTVLVAGVSASPSYGHTPGHISYVVESKGAKLVVLGDLIHAGAVQFPDPAVAMKFDSDTKAAVVQRKKVFAAAAADRSWLAGAHLAFPGIGHVRAEGKGYAWVPINYGRLFEAQ